MICFVRQDLERRARCVREVLGLGARSVRQVTSMARFGLGLKAVNHPASFGGLM